MARKYDFTSKWEKKRSWKRQVITYILIAVVSGASTGLVMYGLQVQQTETIINRTVRKTVVLNETTSMEGIISAVLEDVRDSVVHITSVRIQRDFFFRPIPVEGTGSGFIISKDGYIITNNHVIKDASKLTVTLASGEEYKAELVGSDPMTDTAVIKIDAQGLDPVEMGNSEKIKVGQFAIAVGNPYRLDNTVTLGVISALNRTISTDEGYKIKGVIQTDAAINPGNSGGPLVNTKGEVIGVNTAILSTTGAYQGIGFSIPINTVKRVTSDIIEKGKVIRPWLGITGMSMTQDLAQSFDYPVEEGVVVVTVVEGGPCDKAGLKGSETKQGLIVSLGDVITEIDGREVDSMETLLEMLKDYEAGDSVILTFYRNGEKRSVKLELGERPEQV